MSQATGSLREAVPPGMARKAGRSATDANVYLKNIVNASTRIAIIATGLDGVITLFNRGAERMLGYTAEEMVGLRTLVVLHLPEEVEQRGLALGVRLGRPVKGFDVLISSIGATSLDQVDWTYLRKDDRRIIVTLSLSEVVDDAGLAIGYLAVAEDITERRNHAHSIVTAYTQLNSVLECMSDCVMTIGHDWTILYGNRRAIEMLPHFEVGRIYWECFPTVLGTSSEAILRRTMETRVVGSYEIFFDAYETWFRVRLFPSVAGLSAFFTDITDERKMQDQIALEQVLREKRIEALSHMAGGLAHEISNPLAIIHALASNLKASAEDGDLPDAKGLKKASDSIVQTADRAIRILRGLRGFAHDASNDPMEWTSIDAVIEQCVEMQQSRFERLLIPLKLNLDPDLPVVLCRETQICQILTNLFNNAADAIEQSDALDRWVVLNCRRVGETIVIDVVDSGPGVEDRFRPHLMEAFFTTKTKGLGMGVGLSLSRAIAQNHGGSLSLCDQDGHTCFQLVLPLNPPSAQTSTQTST